MKKLYYLSALLIVAPQNLVGASAASNSSTIAPSRDANRIQEIFDAYLAAPSYAPENVTRPSTRTLSKAAIAKTTAQVTATDGLQIVTPSDNKLYKAKLAATAKK